MAAGDKYIQCDNPSVGVNELLWAISTTVTATGTKGIRIYRHSVADTGLSNSVLCGMPLDSFETWLRQHIVLDAKGKPALNLIEAT